LKLGGRKTPWGREVGGREREEGGKAREVAGEVRGGEDAGEEGMESCEVRPLLRLPGNSIGLNMFPSIRSDPDTTKLYFYKKKIQKLKS
jgi:hypothetical protein